MNPTAALIFIAVVVVLFNTDRIYAWIVQRLK